MGRLETPSPGPEFLVSVKVATATKTILDYKKNKQRVLFTHHKRFERNVLKR